MFCILLGLQTVTETIFVFTVPKCLGYSSLQVFFTRKQTERRNTPFTRSSWLDKLARPIC